MSTCYQLLIKSFYSSEQVSQLLEAAGVCILYSTEEEGREEIYIQLTDLSFLTKIQKFADYQEMTLPAIDWEQQWALHGHQFEKGYLQIDLAPFGFNTQKTLALKPGPGFGDLSHPTTRLVLHLLRDYLKDQVVIDIGCGSGILALAAATLHAPFVYGIDCEQEALEHAQQNAYLNELQAKCTFCLPADFILSSSPSPLLILMNMISSEQKVAWSSLPLLPSTSGFCLTSGVLLEERETYLQQAKEWHWTLVEERQEEEWLAFCFKY